jgi:hypothetical protein
MVEEMEVVGAQEETVAKFKYPSAHHTTITEYFALNADLRNPSDPHDPPSLTTNRILLDSGATKHFFNNLSNFVSYTPETGAVGLSSRKGTSFKIRKWRCQVDNAGKQW